MDPYLTTIYLKHKLGEQSLRAWKTLLPIHSCKGPTPPRVPHNTNWKPTVKPTTLDFFFFFPLLQDLVTAFRIFCCGGIRTL